MGIFPLIRESSFRKVGSLSLYPESMGVVFGYDSRRCLRERSKYHLATTEEFDKQIGPRLGWVKIAPMYHFHVFDVSHHVSRHALDWQKRRILSGKGNPMSPQVCLLFYEAARRGMFESDVEVLLTRGRNTFYLTEQSLDSFTCQIELQESPYALEKPCWLAHSAGMGDEPSFADRERIFLLGP